MKATKGAKKPKAKKQKTSKAPNTRKAVRMKSARNAKAKPIRASRKPARKQAKPRKALRKPVRKARPKNALRKPAKKAARPARKPEKSKPVKDAVKRKAHAAGRKAAPRPKAAVRQEGKVEIMQKASTHPEMKSEFKVKVQNIVAFTNLGKPISLETMLKTVENTEWQPEQFPGLVYKIKYPRASALIFSQGKIVCTGTKSLEELKMAMKKIVDRIREAGIDMPTTYDIKVENIVASTKIKADLNLDEIAFQLENSEYEPEQFPGLVYRISEPRVAFLLFTSGRIICAGAQNEESIHRALHKFKENLEAIGVKVEPVREE